MQSLKSTGWVRWKVIASACLVAAALSGCGGGSGGGDEPGAGGTNIGGNPQYPLGNLSGSLYYDYPGTFTVFRFSDQTSHPIFMEKGKNYSISADLSEVSFIMGGGSGLRITNQTGNQLLLQLTNASKFTGPVRHSPDDRLIAFLRKPAFGEPPILTIADKSGNRVRNISASFDSHILGWDWLPDGGLVYSLGDTIYVLSDLTQEFPAAIASFTGYAIGNIAVSNDGSRIAFTLGSESSINSSGLAGDVYVMNSDGSDIRQVTAVGKIIDVSWSPDGRYLAVIDENRGRDVGMPAGKDSCPDIYIMPSQGESIATIRSQDPSPAFQLQHNVQGELKDVCVHSSVSWR